MTEWMVAAAPRRVAVSLMVAAAMALTGCSASTDDSSAANVDSEQDVHLVVTPKPPIIPDKEITEGDVLILGRIISQLEKETHAQIGYVSVNPQGVWQGGSLHTGPAWSTIKVPLSIAALRHDEQLLPDVIQAVTVSDNEAAQRLWDALGGGEEAAKAVEAVLRDGGDTTTRVNSEVTRPGFSAFGQTEWDLRDQAVFAYNIGGIEGAGPVIEAMAKISDEQSYGLGQVAGTFFKGGWGPGEDGTYLVRQLGINGKTAITVAVDAQDGRYETGQSILNRLFLCTENEEAFKACGVPPEVLSELTTAPAEETVPGATSGAAATTEPAPSGDLPS